jgi:hypothetical protein
MVEDSKNKIKFLVKFLKEKNAYSKYRHNLLLNKGYHYGTFLKMSMNSGILSNSFFWRDTKEGFDYWRKLNDEFRNKYYEIFH